MIEASQIPHLILDAFWKPKWKKEALGTLKGGQKFLHFKRDLLEPDRIEEIDSRLKDLKEVIAKRDQDGVKEASKQLLGTCEHSLKSYRPPDALADNLEVFFVAIAICLGIRSYYVQPFRIPTGSMQPTLNGIVGHQEPLDQEWKKPNILVQGFKKISQGRSYMKVVSPSDAEIVNIKEDRWLWFFTRTYIFLDDGKKITLGGSQNAVINGLGLGENLNMHFELTESGKNYFFAPYEITSRNPRYEARRFKLKKGQVLAQGWVDTGDLVLVDKMSYHFRKPKRGEVFVFETRGIENIQSEARNRDQEAGSHYIKRLAGTPGDTLQVDSPNLWVNGKLASEKGFRRVASNKDGYHGYANAGNFPSFQNKITLDEDKYFAMGDNSDNSSDSRYWGDIDEYLLVGPGLFALWPFENFGFIR